MPRPRLDWFRLEAGFTRNAKIAQLTDRQFRVWMEVLDAAAQQGVRGHFESYTAVAAVTRRKIAEVRELASKGLLNEGPTGNVLVHDWDMWQRWRPEEEPANDLRKTHESLANHSNKTHESHAKDPDIPLDRPANHTRKTRESPRIDSRIDPRACEETEKEAELTLLLTNSPVNRSPSAREDMPAEVLERLSRPPIVNGTLTVSGQIRELGSSESSIQREAL